MTRPKLKPRARTARKPHNARSSDYASFNELLVQIATESRTAHVGEQQVTMSRSDRLLRLMIDRALQKNVREVTLLLKMMAKNPALAATYRDEVVFVISGALCNV